MIELKHWDKDTWNSIDLGLFGEHICSLSFSHRVVNMKMVHGQLPLGIRWYQWLISKARGEGGQPTFLARRRQTILQTGSGYASTAMRQHNAQMVDMTGTGDFYGPQALRILLGQCSSCAGMSCLDQLSVF